MSVFRLVEDLTMMLRSATDALYKTNRYRKVGYDHLHQDALDEVENVRDLADEILERERGE